MCLRSLSDLKPWTFTWRVIRVANTIVAKIITDLTRYRPIVLELI